MRNIFILMSLAFSFSESHGAEPAPFCFDPKVALVAPCDDETKTLFYFKGRCTGTKFEDTYCAHEKMENVQKIKSEVRLMFQNPNSNVEQVFIFGLGQIVSAKKGMVFDCTESSVMVGETKSKKDASDIATSIEILNFSCADQ